MMTGQKWGMLIVFVEEEENMQGGSDGRSSVHGQVHLKESVGFRRWLGLADGFASFCQVCLVYKRTQ